MNAPSALLNRPSEGALHVQWQDGLSLTFSHARLRAACPCSQCRAARLKGRIDVVSADTRLCTINAFGYGVQLGFSDGHERGIYPWDYLYTLGQGN
jgi:DUF971 family protein